MNTLKRTYIYFASFVSLMAVTWGLIFLLRNLFGRFDRTDIAWQLAVIIVSGPFFMAHWRWAQQLAQAEIDERSSSVRALYLYGVLAALLGPLMEQVFDFFDETVTGIANSSFSFPTDAVVGIAVLGLLWFYHNRLPVIDVQDSKESFWQGVFRQLYQWGFTTAGLSMLSIGTIAIISWLLSRFVGNPTSDSTFLIPEVGRVIVGGTIWILFWQTVQRRFNSGFAIERRSILRKIFLYVYLFAGLLLFVSSIAIIWNHLLLIWFDLESGWELSEILPLVLIGAVVWAYHLTILRQDENTSPSIYPQVIVRHSYQYLTAGIGLLATLIGISGIVSLLIRFSIDGEALNLNSVAGFLATLSAGIPVWLIPWWQAQQRVNAFKEMALTESKLFVRRFYLYSFLLISSLTVLASVIYLVYRLLLLLLQISDVETVSSLAQAFAFGLIGLGVWLYHGYHVRIDINRVADDQSEKMSEVNVLLVASSHLGLDDRLKEAILHLLPHIDLNEINDDELTTQPEALAAADILVAPWQLLHNLPSETENQPHKVILPIPIENGTWAGVEHTDLDGIIDDAAHLVQDLALNETQDGTRRWSIGRWIATAVAGFILFIILINIIGALSSLFF